MGASLCMLFHNPKPKSTTESSSSFISRLFKPMCFMRSHNQRRRRRSMETQMEKKKNKDSKFVTLEDWFLQSPRLEQDNLKSGEFCSSIRNYKNKKIYPSSSSSSSSNPSELIHRGLISEATDSLCLKRHKNDHNEEEEDDDDEEEEEGKSVCSILLSGKTEKKNNKRVRFKLPHVVILYSPHKKEDTWGGDDDSDHHDNHNHNDEDDDDHIHSNYSNNKDSYSYYSPLVEGDYCSHSLELEDEDELCFRLAVNTLPHVSVSSTF